MAWTLTDDLDAFRTATGEFLRARPDLNTVLLTVGHQLARLGPDVYGDRPPLFGWWRAADGRITGAFLRTPPHPVLLATMPDEAAARLPEALAGHDAAPVGAPVGVRGPQRAAEAYATAQARRTGARPQVTDRERLFRLGTLVPPSPAPAGWARTVTAADRDLLLTWCAAFRRDVGAPAGDNSRQVDARIADGRMLLWENGSGPVSMAGTTPAVAGTARIAPVYTPEPHRGRGYAGAVTAAMSQACLDAGLREVLLFTDLANPTSNALYRRLGYVPVEDYLVYEFTSRAVPPGGR